MSRLCDRALTIVSASFRSAAFVVKALSLYPGMVEDRLEMEVFLFAVPEVVDAA